MSKEQAATGDDQSPLHTSGAVDHNVEIEQFEIERIDGAMVEQVAKELSALLPKLVSDPEEAKILSKRAGFPSEHLPEFRSAVVFWGKVVEHAASGMSSLPALVDKTIEWCPGHARLGVLQKQLEQATASPLATPDEGRSPPSAPSAAFEANHGPDARGQEDATDRASTSPEPAKVRWALVVAGAIVLMLGCVFVLARSLPLTTHEQAPAPKQSSLPNEGLDSERNATKVNAEVQLTAPDAIPSPEPIPSEGTSVPGTPTIAIRGEIDATDDGITGATGDTVDEEICGQVSIDDIGVDYHADKWPSFAVYLRNRSSRVAIVTRAEIYITRSDPLMVHVDPDARYEANLRRMGSNRVRVSQKLPGNDIAHFTLVLGPAEELQGKLLITKVSFNYNHSCWTKARPLSFRTVMDEG